MSEMIDRVSKAIAAKMAPGLIGERQVTVAEIARAAIEAMRNPTHEMMAAMFEAMFEGKYDGTMDPMIGAGFEAAIDAALKD